jgi:hypothetical protein
MTTDDIDEAIDWQGREVNCATCAHAALLAEGRCQLKHACVNDRYARRIDRFFDWNPVLANGYLAHPHFEVRAIAAKTADVFRLPPLLRDPDETVRWNAVRRLPRNYLLRLIGDPHREVRIRIANLLAGDDLKMMMTDRGCIPARGRALSSRTMLPWMMIAKPWCRVVVANGAEWLMQMAADDDAEVRLEAARRLSFRSLSACSTIPTGACATRWRDASRSASCPGCRMTPIRWCGTWCRRAWEKRAARRRSRIRQGDSDMANISRDSDVVELNDPPLYNYGDKVRARRTIRNDGTYPGKDIGDILVKKGDEGVVINIGTFLQQFYIYGVEFYATSNRVGMKRKELEPVDFAEDDEEEVA